MYLHAAPPGNPSAGSMSPDRQTISDAFCAKHETVGPWGIDGYWVLRYGGQCVCDFLDGI